MCVCTTSFDFVTIYPLAIRSLSFFLAVLGLPCCVNSIVVEGGGYSLVAMRGLLIVAASLVVEHRL